MDLNLDIETWTRNTYDVEAVRVTDDNLLDVCEWIGGGVRCRTLDDNPKNYILTEAMRTRSIRSTKVFVGDWVVRANGQFLHYHPNQTIELVFHKKAVMSQMETMIGELFQQAISVDIDYAHVSWDDLVRMFSDRAMDVIRESSDE